VDLKESTKGVVVMEINDNASVDSGVEDKVLGDNLYRIIIQEFIRRLDLRKSI
jgi:glutathione synthase/RimK-type ligase-like ATP-grasp enzyme